MTRDSELYRINDPGLYGRLLNRIMDAEIEERGMRLTADEAHALGHMVRLEWESIAETADVMDEAAREEAGGRGRAFKGAVYEERQGPDGTTIRKVRDMTAEELEEVTE